MATLDIAAALAEAVRANAAELGMLVRDIIRAELNRCMGPGADDLLSAEQAAALLGMSPAALRRAEERGRAPVPAVRLGRRLRWRRSDLIASARGQGSPESACSEQS